MTDIELIKQLRNETGHSIAKCKEALEEAGGTMDTARELLRERGTLTAQKKADRDLNSGVVQAYIHTTNRIGGMIELFCETDFVARNEEFVTLARDLAMHCTAFKPQYCSRESVPQDVVQRITDELRNEVDSDKPQEIQEKILQGKVDAKLREVVLLEQSFLKDDTHTVQNVIDEAIQKFGERMEVGQFVVWNV